MKGFIKIALLVVLTFSLSAQSFKDQQLKNQRVKKAYEAKWAGLEKELQSKQINPKDFEVFVRAFKAEGELEVWVKNQTDKAFTLLKKIPICAKSGGLGPKRREGDGQVPEGLYEVSVFNPNSNYFLALKVSYPNASDKILATGPTGGDIMIHGNCVTIGCIPLQDEPVKDLYILCVEAKNRKLPIRVEIYPCHLSDQNMAMLKQKFSPEHNEFWNKIKTAYVFFEEHKLPVKYSIDKKGNYVFPQ